MHPDFRFGLIADVQYANVPDALNFQGTKFRRYKQSLQIFKDAIKYWNSLYKDQVPMFTLILGDLVDGKSRVVGDEGRCLTDFLNAAAESIVPCFFTFGNHCHYSMTRSEIYENFCPDFESMSAKSVGGDCRPSKIYYDWSPYPGWRFISLDGYDLSTIGASSEDNRLHAKYLLARNNPNDLSVSGKWFNNLPREKHRWVPYNGGIGDLQLRWLESVLTHCQQQNEKVVIFCHQAICAPYNPKCLLWNAEELQQIVWSSKVVKLWIAGHDHDG